MLNEKQKSFNNIKKIAIFHNLYKGGAFLFLEEIAKILKKKYIVDIFTYSSERANKNSYNHLHRYHLRKTKSLISHILQLVYIRKLNQKIAKDIDRAQYDLLIIFPCLITQSPYILRYTKTKNIYIFTESKREFYEKTSYDHWSIKRRVARMFRSLIKAIDYVNCKKAKNILSISYYSQYVLKRIYKKKSIVVYPGLVEIKPTKKIIINNKKLLSVGSLSMIKGHDFTVSQIKNIHKKITILGQQTEDTHALLKIAKKNKIRIFTAVIKTDYEKNRLFKKHSIYLSNQNFEPFGISTLEACGNKCFVLSRNEGGSPEIVRNGLNGVTYENSIKKAAKVLRLCFYKHRIYNYQTCKIDWGKTVNKIEKIISIL